MPPCPKVVEAFRDWDSCLEDFFEQLFPPGTWEQDPNRSRRASMQLHLPVRLGGFGIRPAASLSPLSYVCGWVQAAWDIAQLGVAGKEVMFAEDLTTSAGAMPGLPLCVAAPPLWLFQERQQQLAVEELQALRRSARDDATLARFTSLQGPEAGAWVSAVPAHSDLTFTAAEWVIGAAIRLKLPIQKLQVAGRCVSGTAYVDPADPHHALRCKHQHGPSGVHDEVTFVVARISKASWGQNVAICDLDFDAILAAMYAMTDSAEGDFYLSVLPDLGIEAAALGASASAAPRTGESAAPGAGESALSGTAPTEALHTFTLESGASRSFFRDSTTLVPLSRPVAVSLADPSGGPVLAHSSTVLPCPAAPSGLLSGLHLPSFSTNLHVTHCTCSRTGRHLATFTRQPGSSLYTLTTASPPVTASGQVVAFGQVFYAVARSSPASAPCSCHPLSHETLLWHHRLGHPSLPRLRGMASRTLVSSLPRSLPPLPPRPAPTCVPCVEGRQRAAPHSSTFPLTEAPLQTLHMDVWGPARVRGQGHERYFLLVVDDYSLYTTVFPLRRKGEVTEVLIDWIRGAHCHLSECLGSDLPVLRLHSDRGGEFSFDLLRAFCRAEGICQTSMLLASPQQNGIAECRIGMVMDVARTSMIHAAAPHFHWPFAVQYAAHQINLQPRVDPAEPVEVVVDSGAARGAEPAGAGTGGAEPGVSVSEGAEPKGAEPERVERGGAEPEGAESGSAEPRGSEPERVEPGGVEPERAKSGGPPAAVGAAGAAGGAAVAGAARGASGAAGGAAGGPGDVGGPAGFGAAGGAGGAGPRGARTGGTGAARAGGAARVGAAGARAVATGGAFGAGAVGGTGAGGAVGVATGDPGAEGTGAVSAISRGIARPRPYYVPLLQQPASPMPGPSPYSGPTRGLTERREPESRPVSPESRSASPVRTVRAGRRVLRPRPPPVPDTHSMTMRPSSAPQRLPLPSPPASSLPDGPDPESDSLRAASPTLTRFLATAVTDPLFESTAASALVVELVDFATAYRLDFATSLVAESASASICPPSIGGESALGTDVLEDRQEDFECFAAAVPHLVSMLLAPEGDPDAPDIPTPRSYAEAIKGPYSSQWQAAMDVEMASLKSTGTYVDEVPPPGANFVSGMWIFRVMRPPGSPPVFKAR
ncbi:unnamed protein product [Closterium sp. NIES-54]